MMLIAIMIAVITTHEVIKLIYLIEVLNQKSERFIIEAMNIGGA